MPPAATRPWRCGLHHPKVTRLQPLRASTPESRSVASESASAAPGSALGLVHVSFANLLSTHSQLIDARAIHFKTDAGLIGSDNGSARRHGHGRCDDVLFPVTGAGRNVAGQGEAGQRR